MRCLFAPDRHEGERPGICRQPAAILKKHQYKRLPVIPRRRAQTYKGEWNDLRVWMSRETGGEDGAIEAWQRSVADFIHMPHTAAISSGRRGMAAIFEYLRLGAGDEVIIPAYTLGELIPLIRSLGAAVVPADIDPATLNVTAETVRRRITPKTKAVLALHAFGAPCPIASILSLASQSGIAVIEDCAHSLGAGIGGGMTGTFGFASFFSFEPTKPANTFGGGMVATRDRGLADFVKSRTLDDRSDLAPFKKRMRAVRMERFMFASGLAFPALFLLATPQTKAVMNRLYRSVQHAFPGAVGYSAIQARLGLKKIQDLPDRIESRHQRVLQLQSLLRPEIRIQRLEKGATSTWYFLVAVLPVAAAPVRKRLLMKGIDAGVGAEIADNCAQLLGWTDCPNVDQVFPHAIALPIFDGITESQMERVAHALNRSF